MDCDIISQNHWCATLKAQLRRLKLGLGHPKRQTDVSNDGDRTAFLTSSAISYFTPKRVPGSIKLKCGFGIASAEASQTGQFFRSQAELQNSPVHRLLQLRWQNHFDGRIKEGF